MLFYSSSIYYIGIADFFSCKCKMRKVKRKSIERHKTNLLIHSLCTLLIILCQSLIIRTHEVKLLPGLVNFFVESVYVWTLEQLQIKRTPCTAFLFGLFSALAILSFEIVVTLHLVEYGKNIYIYFFISFELWVLWL